MFSLLSGQTAGPASQQTSNPDYNAWVDFYRQPMAYFNQGAQQTQAPGLQVGTSRLRIHHDEAAIFSYGRQVPYKKTKTNMLLYFSMPLYAVTGTAAPAGPCLRCLCFYKTKDPHSLSAFNNLT